MKYTLTIDPRIQISEPEKVCSFPSMVRLAGDFTEEVCLKFRQELAQAENAALECGQKVLPIVIDSYGGDVYALLACIDAINGVDPSLTIATIVEGKAMSCGAVLLSCGHEGYRFAGPNSTIMIHEVSSVSWGKNEEIKSSARETDRLNEKILSIMSTNCGQAPDYFEKEITKRKHADWFLDNSQALEHNLVNHIAVPRFNIRLSMDLEFAYNEVPLKKTQQQLVRPTGIVLPAKKKPSTTPTTKKKK